MELTFLADAAAFLQAAGPLLEADPVLATVPATITQRRAEVDAVHRALLHPGDAFEAENRLTLVRARLAAHLDRRPLASGAPDPALVRRLRALLDDHVVDGIGLAQAARLLQAHPDHLVRAFSRATGIAPHQYLTGRRLDLARRRLLAGERPVDVAAAVGFHDQAHLTRHFKRLLGVTPAAYVGRSRT